ncbi:MAG: DHH family phosphoesterase [Clostridia bacterium]|nr:DHH family phosphoesterase [Clostridia bacterium]
MKDARVLKKIKRYMIIYSSILVGLALVVTYLITKNIGWTIIGSVIAFLISILLEFAYIKAIKKMYREENEIKSIKDDIEEELEYNTPVPNLVIDYYGKILWYNNIAIDLLGKRDLLNKKLNELMTDLDLEEIVKAEGECTIENFKFENKYYDIKSEMIKKQNRLSMEYEVCYVLYFFDVTEKVEVKTKYEDEKTLFGYVYIDNYEEILNSTDETKRPMMLGVIERKLQTFAKELGGSIKKMERDRFLLVLSKEALDKIIESKFKILEEIRKINVGNEFPITLSIGFSLVGETIDELMDYSKDAAELAVSRGGDQAVIKKLENDYDYYGAKSKQEIEGTNASKAKARIKAYALKELLTQVDNVLIMGHSNPDLDAIGSAMGMARVCKALGKNVHVVLNEPNNSIEGLYNKIIESEEFEDDYFIKHEEANSYLNDDTLLIVVDVSIPNHTECPELVEKFDKVAVIDHHIRATQFIEKAQVIYLDPFASSACEAVIQIAQYMFEKIKFTELDVDAMLSGILVDTKNFMFKTGVKTFEAAAYLKKCGADNMRVKSFFQNDIESFKKKAEAFRKAEIYRTNLIITTCPSHIKNQYTVVAQIADELLNITGIEASFVVYEGDDGVCSISARSNGNVNVQLIMEEMGGGGHFIAAGTQLVDKKAKEVVEDIKKAIDSYFGEQEEKGEEE